MSRDLKTFDQLLDYLSGTLGEEEKLALETLWKDPEKRSELLAQAAIQQVGDAYYGQVFETLHVEMKPKAQRRKILLWTSVAAAAVISLLLLFGGVLNGIFSPQHQLLFSEHYKTPSFLDNRSGEGSIEYDLEKPEAVIQELKNIEHPEALQAKALGVAYIEVEKYEAAIQALESITRESYLKDEALWLQGLAALQMDQRDRTESYFTQIDSLSFYWDKSQEILREWKD